MTSISSSIRSGILLTIIMLCMGCGRGDDTPPTSTPGPGPSGNQPPSVSILTPPQTQVPPLHTITIEVDASDPDNDTITYSWSSTNGTITGTGNVISWQAPEQVGDYDITVEARDGRGGSVRTSITLTVTTNQSPVISGLMADPATVAPGGQVTLTCQANDSDGKVVQYVWQATEGTVSGSGNEASYFAPDVPGTYKVTVVIRDDGGAEATGYVAIGVAKPTDTVTISPIPEETGTVSKDGDKDMTRTWTGDLVDNTGYRCFWSFDLAGLKGSVVREARLVFTEDTISGKPFSKTGSSSMGGLTIWQVKYSEQLPPFNTTGFKLENRGVALFEQPTTIDVTPEISHLVNAGSNRFQVEALFNKAFNGNNSAEWIEWSDLTLEVTLMEK